MRSRFIALFVLASLAVVCGSRSGSCEIATTATPVYHGVLWIAGRATGSINRRTGNAVLKVRRWILLPVSPSNGIYPDQEPIVIAMGDDSMRLPAGTLKTSRSGKVFSYRARTSTTTTTTAPDTTQGPDRALRRLRVQRFNDGSYALWFTLVGVDLSRLNIQDPVCLPLAVIVGDDDGFTGAVVSSPSFTSRRFNISRACDLSNDWPWIQ
jgi:hypothetical protein